jgi:hypothetical protein
MSQIRQEALQTSGILITGDRRNLGPVGRGVFSAMPGAIFTNMAGIIGGKQSKSGLDDVFGSLPPGTLELGTGPGVISSDFSFEQQYVWETFPLNHNVSSW